MKQPKEGQMPKFLLKISEDPIEFEAPNAEGFLAAWKDIFFMADREDKDWIRTAASVACDWSGKSIRFDTVEAFAADMIDAGMLEEVEDVQG
jgi:hypothetical protein